MNAQETLLKMSLASVMTIALLVGVASAAIAKPVTVTGYLPDPDVLTERVSYADLNLVSADGVRTLGSRVRGAVGRVCAPLQGGLNLAHLECKRFALNGAQPQIELAITRAQEIAANGTSSIAPVAIAIATGR